MADAPQSALNLRLLLASFGTGLCLVLGVLTWRAFGPGPALVLFALAAVGAVDLVAILRRRRSRRRAHTGADHRHDGLFE